MARRRPRPESRLRGPKSQVMKAKDGKAALCSRRLASAKTK